MENSHRTNRNAKIGFFKNNKLVRKEIYALNPDSSDDRAFFTHEVDVAHFIMRQTASREYDTIKANWLDCRGYKASTNTFQFFD